MSSSICEHLIDPISEADSILRNSRAGPLRTVTAGWHEHLSQVHDQRGAYETGAEERGDAWRNYPTDRSKNRALMVAEET
jgi:hypothetical protein